MYFTAAEQTCENAPKSQILFFICIMVELKGPSQDQGPIVKPHSKSLCPKDFAR